MLTVDGKIVTIGEFPCKETYIDIVEDGLAFLAKEVTIEVRFDSPADFFHLQMLTQFYKEQGYEITLVLAYIPYSRMDRKEESRLFAMRTVASILNSQNYKQVLVMEPHSEVSIALLDRVKVTNMSMRLALIAMRDALGLQGLCYIEDSTYTAQMLEMAKSKGIYFLFPDYGASKRYRKQATYPLYIECTKERNFSDGKLGVTVISDKETVTKLNTEYPVTRVIIVDDLSSAGGTFQRSIEAVSKFLGDIPTTLAVAHCENTIMGGDLVKNPLLTDIYTTTSLFNPYNAGYVAALDDIKRKFHLFDLIVTGNTITLCTG